MEKFKDWQLKVQKLMYETEHPPFNILTVDDPASEDYWQMKFEEGLTPEVALQEAVDDANDCAEDFK